MIKGIQIEVEGKTITIPMDKAEELYLELKDIFHIPAPVYTPAFDPFKQIGFPDIAGRKWFGDGDIMYGVAPSTMWPRAGWGVEDTGNLNVTVSSVTPMEIK